MLTRFGSASGANTKIRNLFTIEFHGFHFSGLDGRTSEGAVAFPENFDAFVGARGNDRTKLVGFKPFLQCQAGGTISCIVKTTAFGQAPQTLDALHSFLPEGPQIYLEG